MDYFIQLLELRQVDWLRLPLIQGIATSAVAGAEGLIRASRSALIKCLNAYNEEQRTVASAALLSDLLAILENNLHDDRYAIPVMELTAFLLDGYILSIPKDMEPRCDLFFLHPLFLIFVSPYAR